MSDFGCPLSYAAQSFISRRRLGPVPGGARRAGRSTRPAVSAIRLLSGALALAAIHGDVSTTEKIPMTKVADVAHLKHMAVVDGRQAVGVLDLDKARKYHDSNHLAIVDGVYEPLRRDHCLKGDSPLINYILTADKRPFRLVDIGGKLHAVDVFDLQKLPVRVLLFMKFVHLDPDFRFACGTVSSGPVAAP